MKDRLDNALLIEICKIINSLTWSLSTERMTKDGQSIDDFDHGKIIKIPLFIDKTTRVTKYIPIFKYFLNEKMLSGVEFQFDDEIIDKQEVGIKTYVRIKLFREFYKALSEVKIINTQTINSEPTSRSQGNTEITSRK